MACNQLPVFSRAKNLIGIKAATSAVRAHAMRLDKHGAEATFVGPTRLIISCVHPTPMQSVKNRSLMRSVEVEAWKKEVVVPSGLEYRLNYSDVIGPNGAGCLVITAGEDPAECQPRSGDDLPCDFAVKSLTGTQYIFPPSCEPCESGVVSAPPTCATPLPIPVAAGGCIRPRFFNGMFITREDLETQLRYLRIKQRLQNRAMGQGVVWGLPVFLEGTSIRVGAGYGVDCCGNDLTVTCDYRVAIESLMSDPALCGKSLTCAPLVLEYVECPERPRPVHGEACGQSTPACEMSRVRETVRLRLKPDCDDDHKDPLEAALDRMVKIIHPETSPTTTSGDPWVRPPSATVPWTLTADAPPINGTPISFSMPARTDREQLVWVPLENTAPVAIGFRTNSGIVFSEIEVRDYTSVVVPRRTNVPHASFNYQVDAAHDPVSNPHEFHAEWSIDDPPMRSPRIIRAPSQVTLASLPQLPYDGTHPFRINTATSPAQITVTMNPAPTAATAPEVGQFVLLQPTNPRVLLFVKITSVQTVSGKLQLTTELHGPPPGPLPETARGDVSRLLHARVHLFATPVEVPVPSKPSPCCTDACCGHAKAMDPNDRLILLGLLLYYARILQERARLRAEQALAHTAGAPTSSLAANAQALDAAADRLRRAMLPDRIASVATTLAEFDEAARALFSLWCSRAIYQGPTCGCGCGCSSANSSGGDCGCSGDCGGSDHASGITIGCAYFQSGQLCAVSSLEGRRWVLHPPLLQHWAASFGFPALDESVMRLFSKLCCIRALPNDLRLPNPVLPADTATLANTAALRSPSNTSAALAAAIPNASAIMQPLASMVGINALGASRLDCTTSFLASLLRLVVTVETVSPGALVENVNRFLCHPLCGLPGDSFNPLTLRRLEVARNLLAQPLRTTANRTHPVMREAIADLAASVLAITPTTALPGADSIALELKRAGIQTGTDLLSWTPAELARLVKSEHLAAVNTAIRAAEDLPAAIAHAVTSAFSKLDKEGTMAPAEWSEKAHGTKLQRELKKSLAFGPAPSDHPIIDDKALRETIENWGKSLRSGN